MEQQPFYVGQKVVCVDDSKTNPNWKLKNGQQYTVLDMIYHPALKAWEVVFNPDPYNRLYLNCECSCKCGPYYYARTSRFAPFNPPRVNAIPELLKEPVEERVDYHQPVKILTNG